MGTINVNFDVHDKCLAAFHNDTETACRNYKKALQGLQDVYRRIYTALVSEAIDAAFYRTGANMILFTRSIRPGVQVQRSVFWDKDGEYIALSHQDIRNDRDMMEHAADNVNMIIE